MLQIDRVIGAEAEFAARLELRRDQVERAVVHHPPLGMARLGPGVGVEQIGKAERAVGNALQHLQRVAMMDADVAQRQLRAMIAGDMNQRLRDPIDKGLGANEAMIGQHVGAARHMLAAAETNFEMQRTWLSEQTLRGNFANIRHRNLRQQRIDQLLLPGAQRLAL